MEVKHGLLREAASIDGLDDVAGAVESQPEESGIGDRIFLCGFVAYIVEVAIPAAAGVGEVVQLIEVEIEVRLGEDAVVFVVENGTHFDFAPWPGDEGRGTGGEGRGTRDVGRGAWRPQIPIVIPRQRRPFHGGSGYRTKLPQVFQIILKAPDGFLIITPALGEIIVMVTDFMTKGDNFTDH